MTLHNQRQLFATELIMPLIKAWVRVRQKILWLTISSAKGMCEKWCSQNWYVLILLQNYYHIWTFGPSVQTVSFVKIFILPHSNNLVTDDRNCDLPWSIGKCYSSRPPLKVVQNLEVIVYWDIARYPVLCCYKVLFCWISLSCLPIVQSGWCRPMTQFWMYSCIMAICKNALTILINLQYKRTTCSQENILNFCHGSVVSVHHHSPDTSDIHKFNSNINSSFQYFSMQDCTV